MKIKNILRNSTLLFFMPMVLSVGIPLKVGAWVYPEHREITFIAIQRLSPSYRHKLEELWALTRKGNEQRLDSLLADGSLVLDPKYIDYAAWPAIAGDHSISASDMVSNILTTDWILRVADVAARLRKGLDDAGNDSERDSELRNSDLRLLRADPDYVTRAGSNNVHFMLARNSEKITDKQYFDSCVAEGVDINLIGTYAWYHTSALLKAGRLASGLLSPEERSALALSALADEAFALHFLEDAFSAGHIVGVRGNAALRKGTHDYYDEMGFEVTTWEGERRVLTGDAYMRNEDASRAAVTVRFSLEQLIDAASGMGSGFLINDRQTEITPDTFNISITNLMPGRMIDPVIRTNINSVLMTTPVPGLGSGLGEIPRFRAEIGPFIGIAPASGISVISGGFGTTQNTTGVVPGLEFAIHTGLGLDGVLNESSDGLVFIDLGWRVDGPSSIDIEHDPDLKPYTGILSAVPAREAFYGRLRLPFYIIPGDLLILGPLLYIFAPKTMNKVVSTAGQGGLVPWQSGIMTRMGRFQFVLGREIGIYLYGSVRGATAFMIPDPEAYPEVYPFISMRTTRLEFPVLEYRPVRTFSKRQSASILLQIYAGADIPGKVTILQPENATSPVHVRTIWNAGIRLAFDWRFYYAKKKSTEAH